MNRNGDRKLTVNDIDQWIGNDETLYAFWRHSRKSRRVFIRENRADLEGYINRALNAPPRG